MGTLLSRRANLRQRSRTPFAFSLEAEAVQPFGEQAKKQNANISGDADKTDPFYNERFRRRY
jgi:hypothetical protein